MPERKRAHSDALPTGRSCAQNTIRVNPLILTLRPPLGTATGDSRDPSAADCTDSPPHTGNEGSNTDSVLCRRATTAEEASARVDAATPEAAAAGTTAESGRGRWQCRRLSDIILVLLNSEIPEILSFFRKREGKESELLVPDTIFGFLTKKRIQMNGWHPQKIFPRGARSL